MEWTFLVAQWLHNNSTKLGEASSVNEYCAEKVIHHYNHQSPGPRQTTPLSSRPSQPLLPLAFVKTTKINSACFQLVHSTRFHNQSRLGKSIIYKKHFKKCFIVVNRKTFENDNENNFSYAFIVLKSTDVLLFYVNIFQQIRTLILNDSVLLWRVLF